MFRLFQIYYASKDKGDLSYKCIREKRGEFGGTMAMMTRGVVETNVDIPLNPAHSFEFI